MMKYVLFDTETTGNTELDRIIQVGALVIDSEKYEFNEIEYAENIFDNIQERKVLVFDELCSSEVNISFEAMEVHNITPEMLVNKPKFSETKFSKMLNELNSNENYLIAHNIKFDLGMLEKEGFQNNFKLIDTYKCAKAIFPDFNHHRLQYLRYFLGLYKIEQEEAQKLGIIIKAHDAIGDVLVMKLLLDELLKHKNYEELHEITKAPLISTKFSFGKYKGKSFDEVRAVDNGYLLWAMNNLDDEDLKYSIKKFLGLI
ncbi:3'-5' exonuclease [Campylobacter sp. RM12654]|uniref:3'-5' exonuclease n=1 Tax=Campylobacter sp. RM12654 TaxID=2735738 RepID=UPI0030142902|nr:3'-5' exonuclease [Campylobacter sp. RM12654]